MRRAFQTILAPIPRVESYVREFRRTRDWAARYGVPAHVTLAGPWALNVDMPFAELARLAEDARGDSFRLDRLGMVGDALSILPEDAGRLTQLRREILKLVVTPDETDSGWRMHLTIARGSDRDERREIETVIGPILPLECVIDRLLLVRFESDVGIRMTELDESATEINHHL